MDIRHLTSLCKSYLGEVGRYPSGVGWGGWAVGEKCAHYRYIVYTYTYTYIYTTNSERAT